MSAGSTTLRSKLLRWLLIPLSLLFVVDAIGSYFLARRLSGPIRVLRNSLEELGRGRYDYRIAETRNDEFGELFTTFDTTASALEGRHDAQAAKPNPEPPAA